MNRRMIAVTAAALLTLIACGSGKPTVADATKFVEDAEARLLALSTAESHASWVQNTYIMYDSEIVSAKASADLRAATAELAKEAVRFDGLDLPEDIARRLKLLKLSLALAAPSDKAKAEELSQIVTRMEGTYGRGEYCRPDGTCLDVQDITRIMAESRDPAELLDVWRGWRTISPPMRKDYTRFVELANEGARELGFADTGAMWRSKYDMDPDAFAAELDRLWDQVRPLYLSLHAYVRTKLRERYGPDIVPADGPIPAHLLGNIWAQDWSNIYPLVAPADADPGYDLTAILKQQGLDEREMVRYGERFFTSLGFEPLPRDVLGALDVRQAARPRRRLPRQRLGRGQRRRPAHQDVHRDQRRGLLHDPPRARPQLLPARLQPAPLPVPGQRQRGLPRGDRRHHRALGHAGVPEGSRAADRRSRTRRRISDC